MKPSPGRRQVPFRQGALPLGALPSGTGASPSESGALPSGTGALPQVRFSWARGADIRRPRGVEGDNRQAWPEVEGSMLMVEARYMILEAWEKDGGRRGACLRGAEARGMETAGGGKWQPSPAILEKWPEPLSLGQMPRICRGAQDPGCAAVKAGRSDWRTTGLRHWQTDEHCEDGGGRLCEAGRCVMGCTPLTPLPYNPSDLNVHCIADKR